MAWHDCKTDPPKKSGKYILCYLYNGLFYEDQWDIAYFDSIGNKWNDLIDDIDYGSKDSNWAKISIPYKWAEVNLSEVE